MRASLAAATLWLAVVASVLAASPASADPGDYTVKSCFSDQARHSSRAFTDFATRGMRIRRACNPRGRGLRGLVVGNVTRRKSVRRNARASMTITAAPGTVFETINWSGRAVRSDCAYGVYLYAVGPGIREGRRALLASSRAPYRNCGASNGRQGSASFTGRSTDVRGATRITQRIICKPKGRSTCRARSANYMKLQQVRLSVQDVQPPSVQITGGTLFDGWVRGDRNVAFNAADNIGIQSTRVLVDGSSPGVTPRSCDGALVVPCSNANEQSTIPTTFFSEGTHQVVMQVTDASGLVSQSSPRTAYLDNTPPGAVAVTPVGGDGWRNSNTYSATWANPAEPDRAPITAAHYRLCQAGGQCEAERVTSGSAIASLSALQVPAPGEWTLRVWREDAAGNADPNAASSPVTLRYDPEAPKLAFDALDTTDPTAVKAAISDPLSGVASSGSIELSKEGTGVWQAMPTTLDGDRLKARIDDTALPPGRYLLRASGRDNAGNYGTTTSRADGTAAAVNLPLRSEAKMAAGFVRRQSSRRVVRRKGKRRVVRSRVTTLSSTARVRWNRTEDLSGRLVTADGVGLPNAAVYVFSRVPGGQETYAGVANTDVAGRFTCRVRGDATRILRLAYLGAPSIRPVGASVQMIVPAQTSFRASRTRLVNGQRVVFSGRLAVAPTGVAGGKLVEMQTRLSGKWQTFRTVKTSATGVWRSAYRFKRTRGRVRYRFRVLLPAEAGYPYGVGTSKAIKIGVRGR